MSWQRFVKRQMVLISYLITTFALVGVFVGLAGVVLTVKMNNPYSILIFSAFFLFVAYAIRRAAKTSLDASRK
jgi:thiol:disulfide interchange protein